MERSCDINPVVEVRNLRIEIPTRRGTLTAIDDVSFSIGEGEIVGVVGESGAGKSLSGSAIIGLLEPPGHIAGGEILLEGRRIDRFDNDEMRTLRGRKIGAIFQDPLTSLNPIYTIGKQLIETIQTHTEMNAEQARAHAIQLLNDVGIPAAESRIDSYPHHFSGGMRQRVVIALALCVNPQLVIADEPTTALDVSIQAQILSLLKKMCREHKTAIMLITHDMGVIAEITDRVIVMYAGRIVESGPTRDVVRNPKHPYTKGLMGSIVRIGSKIERLPQIEGSMPRLSMIPVGCAFNPRCPVAFERCRVERPDLIEAGSSNASCWLYLKASGPSSREDIPARDTGSAQKTI